MRISTGSLAQQVTRRTSRFADKPPLPLDYVRQLLLHFHLQIAVWLTQLSLLNSSSTEQVHYHSIDSSYARQRAWEISRRGGKRFSGSEAISNAIKTSWNLWVRLQSSLSPLWWSWQSPAQEKSRTLLALGKRQLKQLNSTGSLLTPESSKFRGTR